MFIRTYQKWDDTAYSYLTSNTQRGIPRLSANIAGKSGHLAAVDGKRRFFLFLLQNTDHQRHSPGRCPGEQRSAYRSRIRFPLPFARLSNRKERPTSRQQMITFSTMPDSCPPPPRGTDIQYCRCPLSYLGCRLSTAYCACLRPCQPASTLSEARMQPFWPTLQVSR